MSILWPYGRLHRVEGYGNFCWCLILSHFLQSHQPVTNIKHYIFNGFKCSLKRLEMLHANPFPRILSAWFKLINLLISNTEMKSIGLDAPLGHKSRSISKLSRKLPAEFHESWQRWISRNTRKIEGKKGWCISRPLCLKVEIVHWWKMCFPNVF